MSSQGEKKQSLLAKWDDIHNITSSADEFHQEGGMLITKSVYGNQGSMMVAVRKAGYHSHPHIHDNEQLNYMIDGELWIFVEKEGYLVQKGDFFRVPRMAIHWAWNRSDQTCTLVETHHPMMTRDPERQQYSVGLFAPDEEPRIQGASRNIFVDAHYSVEVEERLFGK